MPAKAAAASARVSPSRPSLAAPEALLHVTVDQPLRRSDDLANCALRTITSRSRTFSRALFHTSRTTAPIVVARANPTATTAATFSLRRPRSEEPAWRNFKSAMSSEALW